MTTFNGHVSAIQGALENTIFEFLSSLRVPKHANTPAMDSSYVSESIETTLERFGDGPISYGLVKVKNTGEIPLKFFLKVRRLAFLVFNHPYKFGPPPNGFKVVAIDPEI